ncbi:Homeobox protein Hox-D11a [Acipenser ruthenus]|uniref:Homeobox protein Hox-D11a n=1 Tax=Acipenser ruthenus TaxID=7906 RepID=A0A444V0M5_ACIRT|nr:Homeobox protein Hox-D11a [Acipenser ruthenus]
MTEFDDRSNCASNMYLPSCTYYVSAPDFSTVSSFLPQTTSCQINCPYSSTITQIQPVRDVAFRDYGLEHPTKWHYRGNYASYYSTDDLMHRDRIQSSTRTEMFRKNDSVYNHQGSSDASCNFFTNVGRNGVLPQGFDQFFETAGNTPEKTNADHSREKTESSFPGDTPYKDQEKQPTTENIDDESPLSNCAEEKSSGSSSRHYGIKPETLPSSKRTECSSFEEQAPSIPDFTSASFSESKDKPAKAKEPFSSDISSNSELKEEIQQQLDPKTLLAIEMSSYFVNPFYSKYKASETIGPTYYDCPFSQDVNSRHTVMYGSSASFQHPTQVQEFYHHGTSAIPNAGYQPNPCGITCHGDPSKFYGYDNLQRQQLFTTQQETELVQYPDCKSSSSNTGEDPEHLNQNSSPSQMFPWMRPQAAWSWVFQNKDSISLAGWQAAAEVFTALLQCGKGYPVQSQGVNAGEGNILCMKRF